MRRTSSSNCSEREVRVDADACELEGVLALPEGTAGIVLFAHGSGSSRHSPRNTFVAHALNDASIGTLLFDLLTRDEDRDYETRFDISLLTSRLLAATDWIAARPECRQLKIGYFGASTGAAAALQAAAAHQGEIAAVVSRGGRPDLAGSTALEKVQAPTLLIVGGYDDVVIALNERAYGHLACTRDLIIVPGATHLFEEPGTMEQVALHAARWFVRWLV